jgi:hypothetical protein
METMGEVVHVCENQFVWNCGDEVGGDWGDEQWYPLLDGTNSFALMFRDGCRCIGGMDESWARGGLG